MKHVFFTQRWFLNLWFVPCENRNWPGSGDWCQRYSELGRPRRPQLHHRWHARAGGLEGEAGETSGVGGIRSVSNPREMMTTGRFYSRAVSICWPTFRLLWVQVQSHADPIRVCPCEMTTFRASQWCYNSCVNLFFSIERYILCKIHTLHSFLLPFGFLLLLKTA